MNGKRAKKLYRIAASYVVGTMKKSAMEGHNEYNQAVNMVDWEPQLDNDGLPMKDPEGMGLLKPGKFPGTITCVWHTRVMYQNLKRRWKQRHTTT